MSIRVAEVLSRQFDLPKARSPGRKREVPVMGMRHAAEAVNSCRKRNGRTKKRDEYERERITSSIGKHFVLRDDVRIA
jgi:hypothetical protein